jgi:alkanesulfonate monooxygenase SsuD/methylene tetrahydromethanopterin reductase-like flavin-dependent oxidoreductase (luciferase family)
MAKLRLGVVRESVRDGREWLDFARRVEDSGVGTLLLRDHFSAGAFGPQFAPFSGLAAAAAVTTRLLVLSNDFRHPPSWRTRPRACTCCPAAGSSSASGPAGTSPNTTRLPAPIRDSTDSDDPRDRLPAAFGAKIDVLREAAGDRFADLEISAFATFIVTDRRRAATDDLIARRGWTGLDAETVWQMPTTFIGSPDQIRADIRERQER